MRVLGRASRIAMIAVTSGIVVEAATVNVAIAQTTPTASSETPSSRPGIRVSPVILAEPEVETSISIQVGPDAVIPRQTFLRIRGMPLAAKLSDGHVVTPGIWAVPLTALPNLRLLAPLSSSGRTEINLALVGVDGGVLAEAKSSLVVAPAWLLGTGGSRQDASRVVQQTRRDAPADTATVAAAPPVAAPAPPPAPAAAPVPQAQAPAPAPAAAPVEASRPVAPPPAPAPAVAPPPPPQRVEAAPPAPPSPAPAPVAAPPAPAPAPAVVAALPPPAPPAPAPVVAPPPAPPLPPPAAAVPQQAPPAPPKPALSGADKDRAENLVQRGDSFLSQGNLAAARQFFRRAADMGLAAAALRMGATYDPVEINAQRMVGVQAQPAEAISWYEKARELGAPEAAVRLSRLQVR